MRITSFAIAATTAACVACHAGGSATGATPQATAFTRAAPQALNDGWETARAETAGLDPKRLQAMTEAIRQSDWNIHAVLIERDGRLVYEEYFAGFDERWGNPLGRVVFDHGTKHDLRSVTKSVVSALVGTLVTAKTIENLDAPLVGYFPEFSDLQTPERRRVTLKHALTMTAGFEWNESVPYTDERNDEIRMTRAPDALRYALDRKLILEPGTVWNYSGGLSQILGAVVQRAGKMPLAKYAEKHLFEPLGISDYEWVGNLSGMPSAASGLRLRPRDLAKIGSVFARQGQWKNRRVLATDWVEASTKRHVAIPEQAGTGYGYQWWHRCVPAGAASVEMRMARGNGGQRVAVLPALNTVVTVLAGKYNASSNSERVIAEHVLAAFQTPPRGTCSTESSQ